MLVHLYAEIFSVVLRSNVVNGLILCKCGFIMCYFITLVLTVK